MSSIGVYNECGKLKEVIVGSADNAKFPTLTQSISMYLSSEMKEKLQIYEGEKVSDASPGLYAKLNMELQRLIKTYENEGIKVHQARALTDEEDRFLEHLAVGGAPAYMRDPILVVGKTIIELSLKAPYRRKEIFAIREILQNKIAEDNNIKYISMPQPLPVKPSKSFDGPGPFLEGGDIFIMDKNIFIGNSGLASNTSGIQWLNNTLKPEDYTIHEIPIKKNWLHLDCILSIIKPGLCICYLEGLLNGLPEFLTDWDIIPATFKEAHALGCNTICLDANKVLIGAEHVRLINELERIGVEVVSVPMENVSKFGGSIRCLTHPLVRT